MKKEFIAGVYNTVGLNDPDGKGDSSPQAMLDKIDFEQLTDDFGALSHVPNGPTRSRLQRWITPGDEIVTMCSAGAVITARVAPGALMSIDDALRSPVRVS